MYQVMQKRNKSRLSVCLSWVMNFCFLAQRMLPKSLACRFSWRVPRTGVEISFFCLTGHFCCWRNQIAVHLLQLRVLLVQYIPCFVHLSLEAFPISAIRKCLICRKSTFSHLFYSIFSLKIPSYIAFLFPTPLKSKLH